MHGFGHSMLGRRFLREWLDGSCRMSGKHWCSSRLLLALVGGNGRDAVAVQSVTRGLAGPDVVVGDKGAVALALSIFG